MSVSTWMPTAMLPSTAPVDDAGRLLLLAVRRMAVGGLDDAHAAAAMLGFFGRSYRRPLVLLRALMAELARSATAPITVAPPCCPRMTAAEGLIVAAVAEAGTHPQGAIDSLALVLGTRSCVGAFGSAQALGQAFSDLGRPLAFNAA
ncbi:hypothetical protein GGR88_001059 [Sphingomonas jejuensis]|uniref:Uncharacterized protein n=1 Tax=Sphingomonas jejuensis TaxID=904715 RepID=A0ABX0XK12_9SPHN|nr:DUF6628 family protein [Sphingomonas jejuensis]NJC33585.1 hypothetical protein [Sphingomonas jejuensis]